MIQLPQDYTERIRRQLGEEYEAYLRSLEEEGYAGLRVNTRKISVEAFLAVTPFHLTPVPWTENGFYYHRSEQVTRHPHYYAGLYYIQEPSAMLPASVLPVAPGDRVLDLCAAPGGKATELCSRLQGSGLLVANDASASRAKSLLKNLTVWGAENCCITAETPQRLLEEFGCFFDKILVDAPCSGEGMFRRDHALIEAWREKPPGQYAKLQKEILHCAVQMLRPGGFLVYSTCTFSEEEDEEVVAEILSRHPGLELCGLPQVDGAAPGSAPCGKCVRLWPHRVNGEGHFVALLHKRSGAEADLAQNAASAPKEDSGRDCLNADKGTRERFREGCGAGGEMDARGHKDTREGFREAHENRPLRGGESRLWEGIPQELQDFLPLLPAHIWDGKEYKQIGEQCFLLPPYPVPGGLRYLRTGILAGTVNRGRFEPSQALAMLLDADSYPNTLKLSSVDGRVMRYLKGETIDLEAGDSAVENGWILVCADGFALGWGKCAAGRIKNKYYPGWRLQG